MAELWPSRDVARPRNVADWMVDRLDEFTSMPSGSAKPRMPYDEVLDEARKPAGMRTLELRYDAPRPDMVKLPAKLNPRPFELTPLGASNDLSELQRQQTAFNEERRRLDKENRPLAYGALAAPALLLGSELVGGFGFSAARAVGRPAEFNIFPRRRALNLKEKGPIWREGRKVFERVNGMSAEEMGKSSEPDTPPDERGLRAGEVHHRTGNEHANKFPDANPNRPENLQAIPREVHLFVTAEQRRFLNSFRGRQPTPAEIEQFRQRMDRLIEPYTLRKGLPRPPPRFEKPPGESMTISDPVSR